MIFSNLSSLKSTADLLAALEREQEGLEREKEKLRGLDAESAEVMLGGDEAAIMRASSDLVVQNQRIAAIQRRMALLDVKIDEAKQRDADVARKRRYKDAQDAAIRLQKATDSYNRIAKQLAPVLNEMRTATEVVTNFNERLSADDIAAGLDAIRGVPDGFQVSFVTAAVQRLPVSNEMGGVISATTNHWPF